MIKSQRQSRNESKTDTLCAVFNNTSTISLLHPRSIHLQYPKFEPVLYLSDDDWLEFGVGVASAEHICGENDA